MPANPNILEGLKKHIEEATGKPIGGGEKPKTVPAPEKIPLPDYNDPASRLKYVRAIRDKYHLPAGYGDVFTRFNEAPDTDILTPGTPRLTSRQLALKHSAASGLPPALLYSSAMVEGMSGLYPQNGQSDWSGNEKYPVDGFVNFGLDTFADAYPGLVKKGYLPPDFNKQFVANPKVNEQNQRVNSANFTTADAALQAKAAMLRNSGADLQAYADKNKIPLSDRAKQFFTLAYYNGGPGAGMGLLQEYNKAGLLKDDAFLKRKLTSSKYGQVYKNVMERMQLADALAGEGYKFEDEPPIVQKQ